MSFKDTGTKIIKDQKKLSFDYVPSELPNREDEIQRLFTFFRGTVQSDVSQNVLIHGSVGTGKTAAAKRFCMDFKGWAADKGKAIDHVFINCRRSNNNSSAMWKIVHNFDKGFPDRGFSVGEMMEILKKHLKQEEVHLIVVLDEADALIEKEGSELIYLLSRFDEEEIAPKGRVSLILVSQKNALEFLDEGALSSFKRSNRIRFSKYDPDELYDILEQRKRLALFPDTIDHEELTLLSQIAGQKGDARFGIELMEKSALLAEEKGSEKIRPEDLRRAKAEVDPHMTENRLRELNKQEKTILLAVTQRLQERAFTTTGELEEQYEVVCEAYDRKKLGHTQFWKYVKSLSQHGLIDTKTTSAEDGNGRTTKISLSDVPADVLKEKLLDLIEG